MIPTTSPFDPPPPPPRMHFHTADKRNRKASWRESSAREDDRSSLKHRGNGFDRDRRSRRKGQRCKRDCPRRKSREPSSTKGHELCRRRAMPVKPGPGVGEVSEHMPRPRFPVAAMKQEAGNGTGSPATPRLLRRTHSSDDSKLRPVWDHSTVTAAARENTKKI
jgi:hypothetical protein